VEEEACVFALKIVCLFYQILNLVEMYQTPPQTENTYHIQPRPENGLQRIGCDHAYAGKVKYPSLQLFLTQDVLPK
jgi:hypothetical protein